MLRRDGKVFQLVIDNYVGEQVSESPLDIPPAIAIAGDGHNGLALHPTGLVSARTESSKPSTLSISNIVAIAGSGTSTMALDQSGIPVRRASFSKIQQRPMPFNSIKY